MGLGWQIDSSHEAEVTWERYERRAIEKYDHPALSRVRFLHEYVQPDDLIWTRDTDGHYYLGRVLSSWEYLDTKEARDADITNVVRCHILRVPQADDVPGSIVASFRPPRAIQSIRRPAAVSYSRVLWNQLSGSKDYPPQVDEKLDIFSYLDSESTEDVIFVYLQTRGWLIIPHSRKADTMGYEFVAINRDTSERAVVQVKTGNTPLNRGDWRDFSETVFLFQSSGIYRGPEVRNVFCLEPREIEEFIRAKRTILPRAVGRWVEYLEGDSP